MENSPTWGESKATNRTQRLFACRKGCEPHAQTAGAFACQVSWKPLSRAEGSSTRARKSPGHSHTCFSAAAFARRKRRKDAGGKAKIELSPRTPSCPYDVRKAAAHVWRLWLQRGALNLHAKRKLPSAKSPLEFLCGFRCSRNGRRDKESPTFRKKSHLEDSVLFPVPLHKPVRAGDDLLRA